jgi:anti-anti-sigma factor
VEIQVGGDEETRHLVIVRGELDIATSDEFVSRLMEVAGRATDRISLDLSRVTFMDCAGLRALVVLDNYLRDAGGGVIVAAISPRVDRLFGLLRRYGAAPSFVVHSDSEGVSH